MSKYTTEVRFICEHYAGLTESKGYDDVDDIIASARDSIFEDFDIYDTSYRPILESKILKHYYTREIAAETVGLWKLWLNARMDEIMPYYNKLYESALLKFNPLYDVNVTRSHIRNENFDSNMESHNGSSMVSHGSNQNGRTDKYSDTPQGGLGGFTENVAGDIYLTNARIISDNGTQDGNTNNASDSIAKNKNLTTEDYVERVQGKQGGNTYASMIKEYRSTLINIDKMIIEELSDLFMNIW